MLWRLGKSKVLSAFDRLCCPVPTLETDVSGPVHSPSSQPVEPSAADPLPLSDFWHKEARAGSCKKTSNNNRLRTAHVMAQAEDSSNPVCTHIAVILDGACAYRHAHADVCFQSSLGKVM